jgi:transposase
MGNFASPVRKINGQVIGLDVHQNVIVACWLNRRGSKIAEHTFGGDRESLEIFLKSEVRRRRPHFALEACGGFLWVYDRLVERVGADRVHLAQPRRIQMIANSKDKNDRNDAFWLAYLTFEGRLPEAHVPERAYRELRVASRKRIQGGITKEGSRHLRWALVQAVVNCMRCKRGSGLAIGDWTRARARRLGRAKARVAAARKLAESIWRLFHWGERFDVTKPFGGRALETPALRRQAGLEHLRSPPL